MKDLRIKYVENGNEISKEYDTIMDFMDAYESNAFDANNAEKVEAEFFENELLNKQFNTLEDLFNHCKQIVR